MHTQYFVSEVNMMFLGLGITAGIVVVLILVGIAVFVGCKDKGVRLNKDMLIYFLPY